MIDHSPARSKQDTSLALACLQAELLRLDVEIRRLLRLWQLAGQNPFDPFRGLYIPDTEAESLVTRDLGGNWGQKGSLTAEEHEFFARAAEHAAQQVHLLIEQFRVAGKPPLVHLASILGLDSFECDVFLLYLSPALALRCKRLYICPQDKTRKRLTVNLTCGLLYNSAPQRLLNLYHFSDRAPLIATGLLERSFAAHCQDQLPMMTLLEKGLPTTKDTKDSR